jgi:hypothetical protein
MMQVEIAVKVGGRVVKTQVAEVSGTLEQMEEAIHAMGKRASSEALQATVDATEVPRPLFRKTAEPGATRATRVAPSSDSMAR